VYFVVDGSMPSKILAISSMGNWDFVKAAAAQRIGWNKDAVVKYLRGAGVSAKDADSAFSDVSLAPLDDLDDTISRRWNVYGSVSRGAADGGIIYFENGFVYDPVQKKMRVFSARERNFRTPARVCEMSEKGVACSFSSGGDPTFEAIVFTEQQQPRTQLVSMGLGKSVFARLYYAGGAGLAHFKLVHEEQSKDTRVRIFEVIW
jgi:hypothetical protein